MPDPFATLILTRPREASERFLERLGPAPVPGVRALISPLLEIVPTGAKPDLAGVRGVIFTSGNGVRLSGSARDMAAFCVGTATGAAATAAGWDVRLTAATANDLVAALVELRPPGPLLHVGGVHRRGDIALRLCDAGLPTHEVNVYDQHTRPLSGDALAALGGALPVIVPLFSPRAARQFASQARPLAPLHLVAISDAAMAETRGLRPTSRHLAAQPDAASMADAVANLLRRVEAEHAPK